MKLPHNDLRTPPTDTATFIVATFMTVTVTQPTKGHVNAKKELREKIKGVLADNGLSADIRVWHAGEIENFYASYPGYTNPRRLLFD